MGKLTKIDPNRMCDLECVQAKGGKLEPKSHAFVGAVKIILVEPSGKDYILKTWGSAVMVLATMLMGATVFTMYFFTMSFKLPVMINLHVFLCTMGFQLFLPSGILMFETLFGAASYLNALEKKWQHFIIEAFAVITSVVGSVLMILNIKSWTKWTIHGVTGIVATGLVAWTGFTGLSVLFSQLPTKYTRGPHITFVVPTIIFSSICFIFGLLKESFVTWAPCRGMNYALIAFTIIYTSVVLLSIFIKPK